LYDGGALADTSLVLSFPLAEACVVKLRARQPRDVSQRDALDWAHDVSVWQPQVEPFFECRLVDASGTGRKAASTSVFPTPLRVRLQWIINLNLSGFYWL
jgi:hypothetical protein